MSGVATILVTGGTGQVGGELRRLAWPASFRCLAPARSELDLADRGTVADFIATHDVKAVINCAAYTAVDKAESDTAAAFAANALIPAVLAETTKAAGIPLIHVSTDYVFDGNRQGAYQTDDPIAPIGVYGASKAAGEWAVRLGNPRSVVVRTAWVVSPYGNNFVKTMLRVGATRPSLRVVGDQHGSPTIAADLAACLASIAMRHVGDPDAPTGIFHFANSGPTTWHGFAEAIFAAAADKFTPPLVEKITTAEYPTPTRRPANSLLSTDKLLDAYGIVAPPWAERLPALVHTILAGTP